MSLIFGKIFKIKGNFFHFKNVFKYGIFHSTRSYHSKHAFVSFKIILPPINTHLLPSFLLQKSKFSNSHNSENSLQNSNNPSPFLSISDQRWLIWVGRPTWFHLTRRRLNPQKSSPSPTTSSIYLFPFRFVLQSSPLLRLPLVLHTSSTFDLTNSGSYGVLRSFLNGEMSRY